MKKIKFKILTKINNISYYVFCKSRDLMNITKNKLEKMYYEDNLKIFDVEFWGIN